MKWSDLHVRRMAVGGSETDKEGNSVEQDLWGEKGTCKNNSKKYPPNTMAYSQKFFNLKNNYWVSILCPGTKLITRETVIGPSSPSLSQIYTHGF